MKVSQLIAELADLDPQAEVRAFVAEGCYEMDVEPGITQELQRNGTVIVWLTGEWTE